VPPLCGGYASTNFSSSLSEKENGGEQYQKSRRKFCFSVLP